MLNTIRENAGKIAVGAALLKILSGAPAMAGEGWTNIQPAYNTETEQATVRVEAGSNLGRGFGMYSFLDTYAIEESSNDQEGFYSEARVTKSLGGVADELKDVSLCVEYNGGSFMDDLMRVGLTYMPNLGKDNFTVIKYFPWDSEEAGPQVSVYSTQNLLDIARASILTDYNTDTKAIYMEPEVGVNVKDNLSLFLRGIVSGTLDDKLGLTPVVGFHYEL